MAKRNTTPSPTAASVRRVLWIVLLLVAAGLVISAINRKEAAPVDDISVVVEPLSGAHYLIQPDDVLEILDRSFTEPVNTLAVGEVDMERIERVLEDDPFVLDADAFIDARNRIQIRLSQREPLLRVKDNNGLDYYLDLNGERMPPSRHYAARVLAVTGNVPPWIEDYRTREDHLLRDILTLAGLLREDPFLNALIEQVYVNTRGELVLAPKIGDQTILFGRFDDRAADKLERLKVFYREGLPYEGWQKYQSFDLRYDDQVVARRQ